MIAVVVVGLLLGTVLEGRRLKQRRDYCLQQAQNQARLESYFRSMVSRLVSTSPRQRLSLLIDGRTYKAESIAAFYAARKSSYLHAASRPWVSVPPDKNGEVLVLEPLSQTRNQEVPKGVRPRTSDSAGF
jgi:hypothetical protein